MNRIGDDESRPLIKGNKLEVLSNIERERISLYDSLANLIINTDDKTITEICNLIEDKINV